MLARNFPIHEFPANLLMMQGNSNHEQVSVSGLLVSVTKKRDYVRSFAY